MIPSGAWISCQKNGANRGRRSSVDAPRPGKECRGFAICAKPIRGGARPVGRSPNLLNFPGMISKHQARATPLITPCWAGRYLLAFKMCYSEGEWHADWRAGDLSMGVHLTERPPGNSGRAVLADACSRPMVVLEMTLQACRMTYGGRLARTASLSSRAHVALGL